MALPPLLVRADAGSGTEAQLNMNKGFFDCINISQRPFVFKSKSNSGNSGPGLSVLWQAVHGLAKAGNDCVAPPNCVIIWQNVLNVRLKEFFMSEGTAPEAKKRPSPLRWLLRMIQGALIGGGAILPGISGGVLAVAFGIYRPMMAVLAHPMRNLRRYSDLLVPAAVGWLLGFILFAKLVETMFNASEVITDWLFIGLIAGTLPSLFRTANLKGRSKWSWPVCILAFLAFTAVMFWARMGFSASVKPNMGWFFFCGVVWGLSLVVPGMTSSSLLMSMGLYLPMTSGIASLDWRVIVPMDLGIAAVALSMSRLVNYLFETHYSLAYYCVIGLMLASTIVIVPLHYDSSQQGIAAVLAAAVGFLVAWAMEKYIHE